MNQNQLPPISVRRTFDDYGFPYWMAYNHDLNNFVCVTGKSESEVRKKIEKKLKNRLTPAKRCDILFSAGDAIVARQNKKHHTNHHHP